MRRLSGILLLILCLLAFVLGGCAVDKEQFRKNLLSKIDSGLQDTIESNSPEYLDCFSGDTDIKMALLEGAYWECVWELDQKLPETVTPGSDLTRWVEELDACGTSRYVNKMFKKEDAEYRSNNTNCSSVLQNYYLVSDEEERLDIVVDAFSDIIVKNIATSLPSLTVCFDVNREILNDNIWKAYAEAIAPLTSKYLHRLSSDLSEMQNDLNIVGTHFAKIFYSNTRQFYSTAKLSSAEKMECDANILTDIQLSFPNFVESPVVAKPRTATIDREVSNKTPTKVTSGSKERLIELKTLYDEGIITKEEYEQKRQSIFDEL